MPLTQHLCDAGRRDVRVLLEQRVHVGLVRGHDGRPGWRTAALRRRRGLHVLANRVERDSRLARYPLHRLASSDTALANDLPIFHGNHPSGALLLRRRFAKATFWRRAVLSLAEGSG